MSPIEFSETRSLHSGKTLVFQSQFLQTGVHDRKTILINSLIRRNTGPRENKSTEGIVNSNPPVAYEHFLVFSNSKKDRRELQGACHCDLR